VRELPEGGRYPAADLPMPRLWGDGRPWGEAEEWARHGWPGLLPNMGRCLSPPGRGCEGSGHLPLLRERLVAGCSCRSGAHALLLTRHGPGMAGCSLINGALRDGGSIHESTRRTREWDS